ncbi:MAG TPA: lipase maturation factor family protein, partial [Candidatus Eisenbacteria bacterium]|nr:lipase maturation factor family protein [Candidatus Eisenbacteria bacterium]
MIFDGECGFCRRWVERWKTVLDDRVTVLPYQEAAPRFSEIPPERFAEAVHFFDPVQKRWSRGAEAVFGALAYSGNQRWASFFYRRVPGFGPVSEWVYRWVASHRTQLLRVTQWIWGRHLVPPGERLTVWIFLRLLASIYGIAFVSLWVQIRGLTGEDGIYPVSPYLSVVHERFGTEGYWLAPTVFWMNAGDGMLRGACAAGALVSLVLFLGFFPVVSLLLLWALYLSLATVCRDFLWFQWDGLLLETGFLALFIASWRLWSRPASDAPPSRLGLFLLRWLL